MEQFLITYNFKNKEPEIFEIPKEQYEAEYSYQIKLASWNPNKAICEELEEINNGIKKNVEVTSFYSPDDEEFPELQLIKITTITIK